MMRSLSSAVAGLRAHQTKMDVIGNNISNVNTYGFKASRMTFADVYYQNLTGSKAGVGGSSAGKNPTQIGYGAAVATIDVMNNVTGAATTDRALDVYITGEGFIVSKDAAGKVAYSRLGNLGFDSAGNLIDGGGHLVQGFPIKQDGSPDISPDGTIISDQLTSINVDPKILEKLTGISISSTGAIIGMLEGDPTVSPKATNPNWINNNTMTVPTTSVYNGPVRFAMSGFTDNATMETALGLPAGSITNIEMGSLALPAGSDYKISVDKNGTVTLSRPANTNVSPVEEAVSLTGAVKNGKLVLANRKGDIGLTIEVAQSVSTIPTTIVPPNTTITEIDSVATDTPGYVKYYNSTGQSQYAYVKPVKQGDPGYDATLSVPIFEPTYGPNLDFVTSPTTGYVAFYDIYGSSVQSTTYPYVKTVLGGEDGDSGQEVFQSNGASYNPQLFAAFEVTGYTQSIDGVDQLYTAVKNTTLTKDTDIPTPLALTLHYQMKTTDKGGNSVIFPATPQAFSDLLSNPPVATDYPVKLQLGELSFEISSHPSLSGWNADIATAGPGEEEMFMIGNLVLAKFQNTSGLQQSGTSYFTETSNSGSPEFVMPGLEGTGPLKAGYLEMSSVDVSKEFTDMITTQRGFQANSRIITVSDEMLQELVNLKR